MSDRVSERTDEFLMRAYQLGDSAAFDELYRRFSPKVYGYVLGRIRDRAVADDVFQAVFLKLHSSRSQYDPKLPFSPWLFSVCRSVLIDRVRSGDRIRELENALVHEAPEPPETHTAPLVDLSGLDSRSRRAVELRYLEEASFEEIAKRLEISELNARQLLSRAVRFLRKKGVVT